MFSATPLRLVGLTLVLAVSGCSAFDGLRRSQKFVIENRAIFERAGQAVMAKIMENEKAAEALKVTGPGRVAIPAVNAPDLQKEAAKR